MWLVYVLLQTLTFRSYTLVEPDIELSTSFSYALLGLTNTKLINYAVTFCRVYI